MFNSLITQFGAEESTGIGALGLDGQAFIVQLITFLLVFYVLNKFVFKRVVNLLEKRRKTIEEGVRLTTEMQVEKEKLEEEIVKARQEARKQADELLAASRGQATEIVKKAEESAQVKADKILVDAKEKIEEETLRAKRNLEKDMVELVISATERVSREKLTSSKDKALVGSMLRENT